MAAATLIFGDSLMFKFAFQILANIFLLLIVRFITAEK